MPDSRVALYPWYNDRLPDFQITVDVHRFDVTVQGLAKLEASWTIRDATQFSANRTVREYTEKYYLPAAESFRTRSAAGGALASEIVSWQKAIAEHWSKLNFGQVNSETVGDFQNFRVQVFLGDLQPESVLVELYAQARDGDVPMRQPMTRGEALSGSVGGFLYTAQAPANRPATDYTPRIVPAFRDIRVPLEMREILWQR